MTATSTEELTEQFHAVMSLPVAEPHHSDTTIKLEAPKSRGPQSRFTTLRAAALRQTNRVRKELGLAPLKALLPGIVGDPQHCTIAASVAFGLELPAYQMVSVDGDTIEIIDERGTPVQSWDCPPNVGEFVGAFDEELYPDLTLVNDSGELLDAPL